MIKSILAYLHASTPHLTSSVVIKPKDHTPKAIDSVKSNSHYNSKKSRASRKKRGY